MRRIFIYILSGLVQFCYGQETKEVIVRYPKSDQISEQYYVLVSDGITKHGNYVSYHRIPEIYYKEDTYNDADRVKESGTYCYDYKDGLWESWSYPIKKDRFMVQGKLINRGQYRYGFRDGGWMEINRSDSIIYQEYILQSSIMNFPSSPEYPESASRNNISGDVIISYQLSNDCIVSDFKFIKSLGYGLDREALKFVVKNWRGHPCNNQHYTDTVSFTLVE